MFLPTFKNETTRKYHMVLFLLLDGTHLTPTALQKTAPPLPSSTGAPQMGNTLVDPAWPWVALEGQNLDSVSTLTEYLPMIWEAVHTQMGGHVLLASCRTLGSQSTEAPCWAHDLMLTVIVRRDLTISQLDPHLELSECAQFPCNWFERHSEEEEKWSEDPTILSLPKWSLPPPTAKPSPSVFCDLITHGISSWFPSPSSQHVWHENVCEYHRSPYFCHVFETT